MSLKIYINESVPVAIVAGLKRRGIDAFSARDSGNLGLSDPEQLQFAHVQNAVIFSHDDDFLRLAHQLAQQGRHHNGIIYVHQEKLSRVNASDGWRKSLCFLSRMSFSTPSNFFKLQFLIHVF